MTKSRTHNLWNQIHCRNMQTIQVHMLEAHMSQSHSRIVHPRTMCMNSSCRIHTQSHKLDRMSDSMLTDRSVEFHIQRQENIRRCTMSTQKLHHMSGNSRTLHTTRSNSQNILNCSLAQNHFYTSRMNHPCSNLAHSPRNQRMNYI